MDKPLKELFVDVERDQMRKEIEHPLGCDQFETHIKLSDHVSVDSVAFKCDDVFEDEVLLVKSAQVVFEDVTHLAVFIQKGDHDKGDLRMTVVEKSCSNKVHALHIPNPCVFERDDLKKLKKKLSSFAVT